MQPKTLSISAIIDSGESLPPHNEKILMKYCSNYCSVKNQPLLQLIIYVQIRYTRLFFSFVQDQTKLLLDKKKEVTENTTAENQVK